MKRMIAIIAAACGIVHAQGIQVMFAGIEKGAMPPFESRYEEYVRDRLSTSEEIRLADYAETERLVHKIGLHSFPSVSRSLVRSLQSYVSDSTLIIWGRIEKYTVEPRRCCIFGARAHGEVSVVLTLYSLSKDKYMFVGEAQADAEVRKSPAWFRRAAEVTHINAEDRDKIATELSRQIADRTADIIFAVAQNMYAEEGSAEPEAAEGQESAPSLYEVFEIPSAEAPIVDEGTKEQPAIESPSPETPSAEPPLTEPPPAQEQ